MSNDQLYNPFDDYPLEYRRRLWENAPTAAERYIPQPYQQRFHDDMRPHVKATTGGTGGAKTKTSVEDYAHEALAAVLRGQMGLDDGTGINGRIAITGKTYDAPRQAFGYLLRRWRLNRLVDESTVSVPPTPTRPWRMTSLTGVEVFTVTAKDTEGEEFAARPYTVVHMTEAMQQPEGMFMAAMERVARWPGDIPNKGKIYCEGTFEKHGLPWYPQRIRMWQNPENEEDAAHWVMPSWENRYAAPSRMLDDPYYWQWYLEACSDPATRTKNLEILFSSWLGKGILNPEIERLFKSWRASGQVQMFFVRQGGEPPIHSSELWGQYYHPVKHLSYSAHFDPNLPVDFAFDPGFHRYAGLWFQWPEPDHCNVIDELVIADCDFHKYRERWLDHPATKNVQNVISDNAAKQRNQGLRSTADWWALPVHMGGCGHRPQSRYLHVDVGVQVAQTALSDEAYHLRINPFCRELQNDFLQERLDEHGKLDEKKNKGKDDCRKTLSYYLAWKRGTGLMQRQRQAPRPARGLYTSATTYHTAPPRRSY